MWNEDSRGPPSSGLGPSFAVLELLPVRHDSQPLLLSMSLMASVNPDSIHLHFPGGTNHVGPVIKVMCKTMAAGSPLL